MYFIDQCHQNGIGVIVDWVPGHFPKDGHGLAYFDPTFTNTLIQRRTQRVGYVVFNYSRHEVRNFLVSNALFGLTSTTLTDGVDAVASMLYLDYCRKPGEWLLTSTEAEKTLRQLISCVRQIKSFSATSRYSFNSGSLPIGQWCLGLPMGDWALTCGIWVGCTICWITSAWTLVPPVPSEQHHV